MGLKGKKILITAGPTWVPIDKVRVISNIASGKSGILLAKQANKKGARVTLVLGPVGATDIEKSIKINRFCYFNDLHKIMMKQLKTARYDIVIHSAAVSDYKPKRRFSDKINSKIKGFNLELESTIKIVDKIKKYAPKVFLIIFKLELNLFQNKMLEKARATMRYSKADLAVVNTFSKRHPYEAMIIDENRILSHVYSKERLANKLLEAIAHNYN
ncbi:MAG: phosphopantothenoylcysteine decarboxylase [Candidatus Omnitrophota bacterium]